MDVIFASVLWGPLAIFALRIIDVSMATVRTVLSVRGQKNIVPLIGIVEVTIWLLAVGNAMKHLNSPFHVAGYALGFASGAYIGLWIEEKLAIGNATVQIVSRAGGAQIANALRDRGFGATEVIGQGREGRVELVLAVCRRKELGTVFHEVGHHDANAFVTVEEPKSIHRGWMFDKRRK